MIVRAEVSGSRLETAYQQLKERIAAGDYQPSQRLVEVDLAEALGVSRGTVRTVLLKLQQEGFIDLEPNRGARVRALSRRDTLEMMQLREVLQTLAAELATARASANDVTQLRTLASEMEAAARPVDYAAASTRFHQYIVDLAGQKQLALALANLHYPLVRFQFPAMAIPAQRRKAIRESHAVVDAIESGNTQAARRAMSRHLARIRKMMQKEFQE